MKTLPLVLAICFAVAPAAHAGQLTYTSSDGIFQFTFPDSLNLYAVDVSQTVLGIYYFPCVSPGALVCVRYPEGSFAGTNFVQADFSVTVFPVNDKNACLTYTNEEISRGIHLKMRFESVNGQRFSVAKDGGVATGTVYDYERYRSFHRKRCYELTTMIATTNPNIYEPGAIDIFTRADYDRVQRELKKVLKTFRFLK